MEKFLEFLRVEGCKYEIEDGAVIVWSEFSPSLLTDDIVIPENTTFMDGMDLIGANVTRLPSNLTIYDDCSVYLDVRKVKNVSYSANCGNNKRTIFAFWANDDFLIAAGCFAGTYSEFEERVNKAYRDYKADAAEYKRKARGCIRRLAQKLGKPDPFKKATAN